VWMQPAQPSKERDAHIAQQASAGTWSAHPKALAAAAVVPARKHGSASPPAPAPAPRVVPRHMDAPARKPATVSSYDDPLQAYAGAQSAAASNDRILVLGSFYAVAPILHALQCKH